MDSQIAVGYVYSARRDLEVLIYDYDNLSVRSATLLAGSLFQAWEHSSLLCGVRVPITLGDNSSGFDWGISTGEGHFLQWADFFADCEPVAPPSQQAILSPNVGTLECFPGVSVSPRCWRLRNGQFLVEGAEQAWPINGLPEMRLKNGQVLPYSRTYLLFSQEGQLLTEYPAPSSYGLEDTLYIYDIYAVSERSLLKFLWSLDSSERIEATVELDGLTPCALDDLPFCASRLFKA